MTLCDCEKCDCQVDIAKRDRKGVCHDCEEGKHINTPSYKTNFIE